MRRKRRREHPAWRALLALAISLVVNVLVVTQLDASWLVHQPAAVRRDVAIAPLAAADWEANRTVRPTAPLPAAPQPAPPPLDAPNPRGQVVRVDPSTSGEAKPPRDARYLAEEDRTVAKETKARLVPGNDDLPIVPNAAGAATSGAGGQAPRTVVAAKGPKGPERPAERAEAAKAERREAGAGGASRPERPGEVAQAPATARPPEAGGGADGAAGAGAFDPRLSLDAATAAKVLGRSMGQGLDDVEEGDGTFLNTRAWKYATYFNRIQESVGNAWKPTREIQRRDPDLSLYLFKDRLTVLSITLDATGALRDVKVVRSSNVDFLDRLAVEAFEKAQPFDNPPAGLLNAQGELRYVFGFHVQGERPGLRLYRGPAPF